MILDRRSLLAILASPMFLPVSGAIGAIPAAHVFSHASTRDIAADPTAHGRPLEIPLVDPAMPGVAVLIPVAQVPDALAKWESLTLRLPPTGRTPAGHDARVEWRVVDDFKLQWGDGCPHLQGADRGSLVIRMVIELRDIDP